MSYEKAMKHARHPNLRKGRNQYMGFDTGISYRKIEPWLQDLIEIGRWFKERHNGNSQYVRECIREAILSYRSKYEPTNQVVVKFDNDVTL